MAKGIKTGGRVAGTRNKATADVKAVAGIFTREALETLVEIMRDGTAPHATRLSAANSLLDRAVGKPRQELEHAGSEKEPLEILIRHFSDNGALDPD
ncbi:hypothetical protein [Thiothrix lacustris]|uniref:hypothetical protein n=1 Tax=Thiothrix lacustris TaxID=525917 RepID=UPI000688C969|nr:hypothetical protein [Thiothrix lacustris]